MTYQYRVKDEGDCLKINLSGDAGLEDVVELSNFILDRIGRTPPFQVLLDECRVRYLFDMFDFYSLFEALPDDLSTLGIRVASIQNMKNMKEFHWIETMFRNRSINYKMFSAVEDAYNWLMRANLESNALSA